MAIPTEVITAVISAVIGAASGGGVAWWVHRQDTYSQRVQETRGALLQLLDLRGQMMDAPPTQGRERRELLVQRRAMLLAVAESLAGRASGALTTHDWIALGGECQADRDLKTACEHFERAVGCSASDDLLTQVIALRFLAACRYELGRGRHVPLAAQNYKQAVDLTRAEEDPYLRYNTGLSLELWTWRAHYTQEPNWQQLLEEAKQCYREASAGGYLWAAQSLAELEAAEQSGFSGQPPPHPADLVRPGPVEQPAVS